MLTVDLNFFYTVNIDQFIRYDLLYTVYTYRYSNLYQIDKIQWLIGKCEF